MSGQSVGLNKDLSITIKYKSVSGNRVAFISPNFHRTLRFSLSYALRSDSPISPSKHYIIILDKKRQNVVKDKQNC